MFVGKWKDKSRLTVQILFTALTNGYINGYLQRTIFKGTTKKFCVPGLNCYSCPGALGACPIGSLQAVMGSRKYQFSFYVIGMLMAVGAFMGRFVCGWLCPFGLFQDLLHKIPFTFKVRKVPGNRWLIYLKYVILAVFVVLLPITVVNVVGIGDPWFCKWICPSGTLLGGIPLVISNPGLQSAVGFLFNWKISILLLVSLLSIIIYRPFCRYLCPLGAIYGCFNKVSLYRYQVDREKCIHCQKCRRTCKLDIPVYETPNSAECIRCGACKRACPVNAIDTTCPDLYEIFHKKNSHKTNKEEGV